MQQGSNMSSGYGGYGGNSSNQSWNQGWGSHDPSAQNYTNWNVQYYQQQQQQQYYGAAQNQVCFSI